MITQAIVLSAGLGTRLRALLADKMPKVMVPLAGKPLLLHHVERLKEAGVQEFFINLHYLPQVIQDYFGDGSPFGISIRYAYEPNILGTAGGIKQFEPYLDDAFFVIYGDVYSELDYRNMGEAFLERQDAYGLGLIGNTDHPHDSDLVEMDEKMRFMRIYPKPHSSFPPRYKAMRGMFVFKKEALGSIPSDTYDEIDHGLLPRLLEDGKSIYGYESDAFVKDIGTVERYRFVEEYVAKKYPRNVAIEGG